MVCCMIGMVAQPWKCAEAVMRIDGSRGLLAGQ